MNWQVKVFDELSPLELYNIMKLRIEVFIVEQNCVFQDADDKDQHCYHLTCWSDDHRLAAYTRLVPKGIAYDQSSIGRVITSSQFRNSGLGKELMRRSIDELFKLWGPQDIMIGAQVYLKKFYESFGFKQVSEMYLEDNIEHIKMLRPFQES